jgi:hypothetical protein
VPTSRLQADNGFTLGRSTEISRDELKFQKYIARVRRKFAMLFSDALKVQLISKGIIREDEWDDISSKMRFDYMKDNYFAELKDSEILNSRVQALVLIEPYIGKYYSVEWVRKHVLRMSEDQIEEIDKQIKDEEELHMTHAETQGTLAGVTQVAQQQHLQDNGMGGDEQSPNQEQGDKK